MKSHDSRSRLRIAEKVNLDSAWSFQYLHPLSNGFVIQRDFEYNEVLGILNDIPRPTIPDKKVGTRSKFSPPPTFNVDNQVIFPFFVGETAIFSNID